MCEGVAVCERGESMTAGENMYSRVSVERRLLPAACAGHDRLGLVLLVLLLVGVVHHLAAHPSAVDTLGVIREEVAELLELGREANSERVERRVLRRVVADGCENDDTRVSVAPRSVVHTLSDLLFSSACTSRFLFSRDFLAAILFLSSKSLRCASASIGSGFPSGPSTSPSLAGSSSSSSLSSCLGETELSCCPLDPLRCRFGPRVAGNVSPVAAPDAAGPAGARVAWRVAWGAAEGCDCCWCC